LAQDIAETRSVHPILPDKCGIYQNLNLSGHETIGVDGPQNYSAYSEPSIYYNPYKLSMAQMEASGSRTTDQVTSDRCSALYTLEP
jgi:hypothetical protein